MGIVSVVATAERRKNEPDPFFLANLLQYMKKKNGLLLIVVMMLNSCVVGTQTMTKDINSISSLSNQTILVIGMSQQYRVQIIRGTKTKGGWASSESAMSTAIAVNTFPKDGFIIARVPGNTADEVYGLTAIMPEGIGPFTPYFKACKGNITPVFMAPPGKIVYVGQLVMSYNGGFFHVHEAASLSLDEVKNRLKARFPNVASGLQMEPMRMERLTKALCVSPTIHLSVP